MMSRIQPEAGLWCASEQRDSSGLLRIGEAPNLPLDLTRWVDESSLSVWIQEEILRLDWNNPLVVEYLKHHPEYRPKTMIALLCLGYSTQAFSSCDIVQR